MHALEGQLKKALVKMINTQHPRPKALNTGDHVACREKKKHDWKWGTIVGFKKDGNGRKVRVMHNRWDVDDTSKLAQYWDETQVIHVHDPDLLTTGRTQNSRSRQFSIYSLGESLATGIDALYGGFLNTRRELEVTVRFNFAA